MYKNYLHLIVAMFVGQSLFGQSVSMENGIAKMVISLDGGIITEFSLNSTNINVLHEYGHFLCFDRWGPSSNEDKELGIPFHGNASKITWTLLNEINPDDNPAMVEMSCLLPIVNLGMNRKIYQGQNSSVFNIVEEISNHTYSTKVFNLVQHPTIGAPFLDETTIVDTRVDSGFSQNGVLPPTSEDVINWPEAVVEGDTTDLRFLTTDHTWKSAVVTFIQDEQEEYGWVTAVNPSLNLMVGYLWPVSDYPWLNLWMQLKNGSPFARGLEFGSTGLHKEWPTLLEMDTIFGKKLYEEITVDETVVKSYYAFQTEVPSDYEGVAAVSLSDDTIIIEEYGMVQERRIMLNIYGSATGTGIAGSSFYDGTRLNQNTPNPFSSETHIDYFLPREGHVKLEVFNTLGQSIEIITDEKQERGNYKVNFQAHDLAEGIYVYKLNIADQHLHKKMIIVQ